MILRRLYLYLVSAAALVVLVAGLALLGGTLLLFAFNDPTADASRGQLAIVTAMSIVALPVWGVHFWIAQRFSRDPYERTSAVRRLYLYFSCLVLSLATMFGLAVTLGQLFRPLFDVGAPFNAESTAQSAWATVVFAAAWGLHFWIASQDRAVVPEEGASATLRRWYMYIALLAGLLTMLSSAQQLLQLSLTALAINSGAAPIFISSPAGFVVAGAALWGFHARTIALHHISDDRHSTLRALEGFIAVAISIATALFGASQILYYALARALGVSNPGGAGSNVLEAAAAPVSLLLVYGVAWFLIFRRLRRDAGIQEADRQAGVRHLYTNLASLISLAAWAYGAGALLATVFEQVEALIIGVKAPDWKDPVSLSVTLLVVGLAVWLGHWRQSPWAVDRQSLSRRLYVWAALLGSVLAVLGGGIGLIGSLLQQAFSAHPTLSDVANLAFARYLAVVLIAAGVAFYHWRVLRADQLARPARAEPVKAPAARPAVPVPAAAQPMVDSLGPHSRRYTLVVTDATDDDLHQALSNLPPQANYHLTPAEQAVDGH